MPEPIVVVLDTTVGETGTEQRSTTGFLKKDKPIRFSILLAAGDTVVVEGKPDSSEAYEILHTFTDETPADVFVSALWRVRRTVDGAAGDSEVKVVNSFNQKLTAHE